MIWVGLIYIIIKDKYIWYMNYWIKSNYWKLTIYKLFHILIKLKWKVLLELLDMRINIIIINDWSIIFINKLKNDIFKELLYIIIKYKNKK